MMDLKRNFLIVIFLVIMFLLWNGNKPETNLSNISGTKHRNLTINRLYKPRIDCKKYIFIKTDVLFLTINTQGGDIEKASLLDYRSTLDSSKTLDLLDTNSEFIYQTKSGLINKHHRLNHITKQYRPIYSTYNNLFELHKNQKELKVPIKYISKSGVIYTKTFILRHHKYDIEVEYHIENNTNKKLNLSMFGQIHQTINPVDGHNLYNKNFALQTFRGAAYSTNYDKYKKYKFDDINNNFNNLNVVTTGGWIAMLQKYFATAWIPCSTGINTLYTFSPKNNIAVIGYQSSPFTVYPKAHYTVSAKVWIGPEIQKEMALVAPNLDLTVDYGWLWFLSQPLFKLLSLIYKFVGNWGYSIIIITLLIRLIMYPLTRSQYISIAKMRILQPKMDDIKRKYGNNKRRMSQEIIQLYKHEKVNPLGGCFPLLIQMPIFLSLYYMLIASVELRHAPFCLWINDLSDQDPYYVLPILMGISMYIIQKMSPSHVSDPIQKKVINYVPFIFTIFFLWFPSGLVLYYIISNVVTIIQQKFVLSSLK